MNHGIQIDKDEIMEINHIVGIVVVMLSLFALALGTDKRLEGSSRFFTTSTVIGGLIYFFG